MSDRDLISKLLKLAVTTDSEGEAIAAFRKLRDALEKSQFDIHDLIDTPRERPRSAWADVDDPERTAKRQEADRKRAAWILDTYDRFLTHEQRRKLTEMKKRKKPPSPGDVWTEYSFLETLQEIINHCQNLEWNERKSAEPMRAEQGNVSPETAPRLRRHETVSSEIISPERKAPKAGNGWGGKRKGAGAPRNAEIAATMKQEGVSRATAYRRRKLQG